MASYYLCPLASFLQVLTDAGVPLGGALLWTYAAGTSTPTQTWTDNTGGTPNSNPIQMNSAGRLPNVSMWQQGGVPIKCVFSTNSGTTLSPVFGVQIGPTFDQLSGVNDPAATTASLANASSGQGADLVANAVRSYDVFSSVRAANVPSLAAGQTLVINVEGGSAVGDGLGGVFYWNASSTATDDGYSVLKPNSISGGSPGRYLRLGPLLVSKASNTSRASNTTAAADPDLSLAVIAGQYVLEAWITDSNSATSAGGLKGTIAFSGTAAGGSYWAMNGNGTGVTPVPLVTVNVAAQQMESAQNGVGNMVISGSLIASTAGTLSFNWAQQSSNVTASIVGAGSWLRVTRVK